MSDTKHTTMRIVKKPIQKLRLWRELSEATYLGEKG